MATGQDVYQTICFDLCEDNGLILGIVTDAEFLDMLNETILDFLTRTCLVKAPWSQQIAANAPQYTVPDTIMRVDDLFVAGKYAPQNTVMGLTDTRRNWRNAPAGIPDTWHDDMLPIRTVELNPPPNYTGAAITAGIGFYISGQSPAQHRGLTIVGPQKPAPLAAIGNSIPLIPDDWVKGYIAFGVLERIFSADNENKDPQRALYCHAQYEEGVSLGQSISGEMEDEG